MCGDYSTFVLVWEGGGDLGVGKRMTKCEAGKPAYARIMGSQDHSNIPQHKGSCFEE